jgi:pentatricopeptide repeat protein
LNGKGKEAIELFERIPLEVVDNWIYVCLLNACSHSGLIEEGEKIFNRIPQQEGTEKIYTSMVTDLFSLVELICK